MQLERTLPSIQLDPGITVNLALLGIFVDLW